MAHTMDMVALKAQVESAMEVLLRTADATVSWKQPPPVLKLDDADQPAAASAVSSGGALYSFIPGVYSSTPTLSAEPDIGTAETSVVDEENGRVRLLLHGDNSFEYSWTLVRRAPRAMEFIVEMTGDWNKPVLNRSRRGEEDQRVFLHVRRMRFQRLSNYDPESKTWKLCLRTLTRQGTDWAPVGETERGVPPIVMTWICGDDFLESIGSVLPAHVLANSPACRVLAGLTKKIANKLGGPIDVMTEKWLPPRHYRVQMREDERGLVKLFNPLYCLAKALREQAQERNTHNNTTKDEDQRQIPASASMVEESACATGT